VGAGCEVVRDSPVANLRAMVDYAKRAGDSRLRENAPP